MMCSTLLMPLFISCRFSCCGLRVRAFVWAGRSLPLPPSSLHILSLPVPFITSTWALPCLGASVCSQREEQRWKPHTDQKALYKRRILLGTVVWKALGRLCFVFMQNDHLPSSLVRIFHHSQMKSCCFMWVVDWLVSLCFLGSVEFWACLTGM